MGAEPIRTCIVCRKKGTKDNFFKIVKNKDGNILVETGKKLEGRGAYICKDEECILKCEKSKALNRTFKTNVSSEIYGEIKWNLMQRK